MPPNGWLQSIPASWPAINAVGTPFCQTYWRVNNSADSLFTHEAGMSHTKIQACTPGSWNGFPSRLLLTRETRCEKDQSSVEDRKPEQNIHSSLDHYITGDERRVDPTREADIEESSYVRQSVKLVSANRAKLVLDWSSSSGPRRGPASLGL